MSDIKLRLGKLERVLHSADTALVPALSARQLDMLGKNVTRALAGLPEEEIGPPEDLVPADARTFERIIVDNFPDLKARGWTPEEGFNDDVIARNLGPLSLEAFARLRSLRGARCYSSSDPDRN